MFEVPKTGMWAVLNEECVVPKGTDKVLYGRYRGDIAEM